MTPLLRLATLVVAALTMAASAFAPSSLTLASTDGVVPAGGSETIENVPLSNVAVPAGSPGGITVDFNDLASAQPVDPDRYIQLGLHIEIGPSSTTSGGFIGSLTGTPCDGTRSLKPDPFGGPSFLFRFPNGVTSVSLDAGDIGPSDSDVISVKAFSDDALTTLIDVDAAPIPQGAPTGCVRLSVQTDITQTTIIKIKAVEITSDSYYLGSAFYPNSIFVDNVTFSY
jgi:hypothetical protein